MYGDGVVTSGGLRHEPGARFMIGHTTWVLVRPYLNNIWICRDAKTGQERLHDLAMP